jgi:hypothetical protein
MHLGIGAVSWTGSSKPCFHFHLRHVLIRHSILHAVSVEATALPHIQPNLPDVQHVQIILFRGHLALCVHIAIVLAAEPACRYEPSSNVIPVQPFYHFVFLCRQEAAAAGTKRPRPQEPEPALASNSNGAAQTAEASAEAPAVAMAADAAAMTDPADTAAMAAAVAVNQRADAILHNVS